MNFISHLKQQLQLPLPGREAQLNMAPTIRRHYIEAPNDARIACVLILFFFKNEEWNLALIERQSSHPKDKHGGQMGFPGGKLEDTDPSLLAGALREAEEEVGIDSKDVHILGRLTELYIPVSNFLVHPFIGYLDYEPAFVLQESEVKAIFTIPISDFQNPKMTKSRDIKVGQNLVMKNVPYYQVQGKTVWGATAMMLSELVEVSK